MLLLVPAAAEVELPEDVWVEVEGWVIVEVLLRGPKSGEVFVEVMEAGSMMWNWEPVESVLLWW